MKNMELSREQILKEERDYYYETVKSAREEYIYYCVKHGMTLEKAKEMAYSEERYPEVYSPGDGIIFHETPSNWAIWDIYGEDFSQNPALVSEARTISPIFKGLEDLPELVDKDMIAHRDRYILACVKHGKTLQEAKDMAYRKYRYPLVPNPLSMIDHYYPTFWAIHDIYGDEKMRNDKELNDETYEWEVKITGDVARVFAIDAWIKEQEPRVREILRKVDLNSELGKRMAGVSKDKFMTEFCKLLPPVWKDKLVEYGCVRLA
jgi:hypothetical protein